MTIQEFTDATANRSKAEEVQKIIDAMGAALPANYNREALTGEQVSAALAGTVQIDDALYRVFFNRVRSDLVQEKADLDAAFAAL